MVSSENSVTNQAPTEVYGFTPQTGLESYFPPNRLEKINFAHCLWTWKVNFILDTLDCEIGWKAGLRNYANPVHKIAEVVLLCMAEVPLNFNFFPTSLWLTHRTSELQKSSCANEHWGNKKGQITHPSVQNIFQKTPAANVNGCFFSIHLVLSIGKGK